jgi:hypothetical protein
MLNYFTDFKEAINADIPVLSELEIKQEKIELAESYQHNENENSSACVSVVRKERYLKQETEIQVIKEEYEPGPSVIASSGKK